MNILTHINVDIEVWGSGLRIIARASYSVANP